MQRSLNDYRDEFTFNYADIVTITFIMRVERLERLRNLHTDFVLIKYFTKFCHAWQNQAPTKFPTYVIVTAVGG